VLTEIGRPISTFIAQLDAALKSSTNCLVVIGARPTRSSSISSPLHRLRQSSSRFPAHCSVLCRSAFGAIVTPRGKFRGWS